ncbi:amino acid ABC transporter substrate-binding protein [Rhizobium sp. TH2]|uniref:amino acid ABC transporter substrate-binding protein n=1 Tax=Rhizobium sp. TH2 TaxID=2775403 RepID=UPI0021585961|nr:amino acid ABC transporter substrate-binding protein [Rhizobium sp. TH2]UVC11821.1 amino acid ABC transporter substrate-binding protein [Rhizobium sp. TH2]
MRRFLLTGIALCFSALAAGAATLEAVTELGTVRIGYIGGQAPFASSEPGANPVGYAVDLCDKVADEIEHYVPELKREYVELKLADGFDAVKNGKVDLLCGAITVNLERREIVDFSQPIFLTGATALLRKDSPSYLQPLFLDEPAVRVVNQRIASKRVIGVRANTTTDATLRQALALEESKMKIADFETHEEGLAALEDYKIDAYFADRALLISLAMRARDPSSLEVGDRLFSHEPYAIAVRRNDAEFRLVVDRALTGFYQSDDFLPLLTTYFGSEAPMLHTQVIMEHVP